jgi:hypothetical protein
VARSIVVRVFDLYDPDWNAFVLEHSGVYADLLHYYGASVHVVLSQQSNRHGQLNQRDCPRPEGFIELRTEHGSPMKLAADLADVFNRAGKPYCHATVSVVIVRDKVSHSFGGAP